MYPINIINQQPRDQISKNDSQRCDRSIDANPQRLLWIRRLFVDPERRVGQVEPHRHPLHDSEKHEQVVVQRKGHPQASQDVHRQVEEQKSLRAEGFYQVGEVESVDAQTEISHSAWNFIRVVRISWNL